MSHVENNIFKNIINLQIYAHYLDDIFILTQKSKRNQKL